MACQAEGAALFRSLREVSEQIVENLEGRRLLRLTNACAGACVAHAT
jgi:hypothetical protein